MPAKASKGKASAHPKPAARERPQTASSKKKPIASLRKPSAPKSVDDFVTAGGEASAGAASEGGPRSPTLVARKDGTERRRTTVYFAPELSRRLNVYCATHDLEMSQVVGDAVEALLVKKGT
jgi:hypothetical protein